MKNSEQRLKTKEYWQTKIREAESFSGPETEFCRQEGLNNTAFKNWKYRLSRGSKSGGNRRRRSLSSTFVPVEVKTPRAAHSLPDAQWVAELIFYLQGGTR
ncbi:MAG: hypothetical protein IPJ71_17235 [Bdellovibrionales bacterium]|nr:hypothetical protein [Bdellovibrionales bacterium]